MVENGFTVVEKGVQNLVEVKTHYQIPTALYSCHTAVVDGYIIEGHVPAATVQQLLKERPDIIGISVPGMPAGSPGMETPGVAAEPFEVLTFNALGETAVYATYP